MAALCIFGQAQTQDQQAPPGDSSPSSGESSAPAAAVGGAFLVPGSRESGSESYWMTRPRLPAIVGGYGSSLAFGSEMERSNYIRGGLTFQATYNDNALLSNPAITNYTYSIFPQIALDQSRSRVHWILAYAGGFTYNDKLTNQNQTSQDVSFDLQYRVSPHVNCRVTEEVTLKSGLFGPVNALNGTTPGVPVGSNPFILTPLAKTFANVTRADISYQFSATDLVGASGGFDILQYRDTPSSTAFVDTKDEDAAGYYMHRITSSNWIGGSYVFQHLGYSPVVNDTVVHSAIGFDTWQFKRTMSISLFAGPQYSDDRFPGTLTPVIYRSMWSVAGGASYNWQGHHTAVSLSYARRIADGGGLLGSVELNSFAGSYRQQITRRWSVTLNGGYGANDPLAGSVGVSQSINSASGGVSLTRQFADRYFLQMGYVRQSQTTTGLTTLSNNASQNNVIASFSYQFERPWGR